MHTIGRLKRIEDAKWDTLHAGFNNNIRWHAGHLFVTIETFIQQGVNSYEPKYPEWISFFDDGTSPRDWKDDVPAASVILAALREQLNWATEFLEGKLEWQMSEPLIIGDDIMTFDDMEGIVQFLAWHEGVHAGVIDALGRFQPNENLSEVHNIKV